MATPAEVRAALTGMRGNAHDHGWHRFYAVMERVFAAESRAGDGPLTRITKGCYLSRPSLTAEHFATLLSIAIKAVAGDWRSSPLFDAKLSIDESAAALEPEIEKHENAILELVLTRQNSFSGARRFLAFQPLVSAFAARAGIAVRLVDLGTGAGLLPRQLNSRSNFERFAPDLKWDNWDPQFVEVPYEARWGVDRTPPEEGQAWIGHSYGPSDYYDDRYGELKWAFAQQDVIDAKLLLADIDLLGPDKLAYFLRETAANVVTCSFVLYQYEPAVREKIIEAVVAALPHEGGLFLSLEPTGQLLIPGAYIRAYLPGRPAPLEIAWVSDGHCVGDVITGPDFAAFHDAFLESQSAPAATVHKTGVAP